MGNSRSHYISTRLMRACWYREWIENGHVQFTPDWRSIWLEFYLKSEQPNSMTWCKRKKTLHSTAFSQAVAHPSSDTAQPCVISLIRRVAIWPPTIYTREIYVSVEEQLWQAVGDIYLIVYWRLAPNNEDRWLSMVKPAYISIGQMTACHMKFWNLCIVYWKDSSAWSTICWQIFNMRSSYTSDYHKMIT